MIGNGKWAEKRERRREDEKEKKTNGRSREDKILESETHKQNLIKCY